MIRLWRFCIEGLLEIGTKPNLYCFRISGTLVSFRSLQRGGFGGLARGIGWIHAGFYILSLHRLEWDVNTAQNNHSMPR